MSEHNTIRHTMLSKGDYRVWVSTIERGIFTIEGPWYVWETIAFQNNKPIEQRSVPTGMMAGHYEVRDKFIEQGYVVVSDKNYREDE